MILNGISLDGFDGVREKVKIETVKEALISTGCQISDRVFAMFQEFSEVIDECATRSCVGPLQVWLSIAQLKPYLTLYQHRIVVWLCAVGTEGTSSVVMLQGKVSFLYRTNYPKFRVFI
jgi:hypothetical protein